MRNKILVGWQEWCALPDLEIAAIKVKVDTGARTSALHAFDIEPFQHRRKKHVRFCVHPLQHNHKLRINCCAQVIDEREVISSNGHREHRYVIETALVLGDFVWNIELTLSNRDPMKFRMLLGREALAGHVMVDPIRKFCQGVLTPLSAAKLYRRRYGV